MAYQAPFDFTLNTLLKNLGIITAIKASLPLLNIRGDPHARSYLLYDLLSHEIYEHNLTKIIDYKKFYERFGTISDFNYEYATRTSIDIPYYLDNLINEFNTKILKKLNWFTSLKIYRS
jgi:hypothetical protein